MAGIPWHLVKSMETYAGVLGGAVGGNTARIEDEVLERSTADTRRQGIPEKRRRGVEEGETMILWQTEAALEIRKAEYIIHSRMGDGIEPLDEALPQ